MTDCHMHMVLDGDNWRGAIDRHRAGPREDYIRAVLDTYRRRGVTYLRDGGDRWGVGAAARALAPEYGITYRTPLAPLYRRGHYGAFIGTPYEDLRDYARQVADRRRAGADFIKVMVSGLMDFDRCGVLTEEPLLPGEIAQLIHIAHEEGMSVMLHCNGEAMLAAGAFGADSVEHGAYPCPEALAAMAENRTVLVPTLSTVGALRGKGRFSEAAVEAIFHRALETVADFAALGGLIAPGSDAGAWAVPHSLGAEEGYLAQALGENTPQILARGIRAIQERF